MVQNDILKEIESSLNSFNGENWNNGANENKIVFHYETILTSKKRKSRLLSSTIFMAKYIATSTWIFLVLLLWTNYTSYYNIAKSYVMKEQVEQTKNWLINSVEAAKISNTEEETKNLDTDENEEALSAKRYKKELDSQDINLDIDITTLENRIIIPKMGRNIPLLDIKNRNISWQNELEDIFMKELENWVIRYPGSAKPGEEGLTFIFWHSSNFPWLKWDYNSIFATLDRVMIWDEVIIYYNQKKYTFKIKERTIIKPGDVNILKRNKNKSEVAIMTCWPIGTTLNRFVIIGELTE